MCVRACLCWALFCSSAWKQRLKLSIFFVAILQKHHHGHAIIAHCCCHGTSGEELLNEATSERENPHGVWVANYSNL